MLHAVVPMDTHAWAALLETAVVARGGADLQRHIAELDVKWALAIAGVTMAHHLPPKQPAVPHPLLLPRRHNPAPPLSV